MRTKAEIMEEMKQRNARVEPPQSFDVVVEQVIGTVDMSPEGTGSPFRAAMEIVTNHQCDTATSSGGYPATYAFPSFGEGERVRVEITHTKG